MKYRGCATAEVLYRIYVDSLSAFHQAQHPMLGGILPEDPKCKEVRDVRERAHEALLKARRLYWDHVQGHTCRAHIQESAEPVTNFSI
jgi:hypothetical protein